MIRILAYLLESAVLATIFWLAALLVSRALGLATGMRLPVRIVGLPAVFVASLAANVLATEIWGADYLFLHWLAVLALSVGVLSWVISLLLRTGDRSDQPARKRSGIAD